jgi:ABC-2 type transport system permease protein
MSAPLTVPRLEWLRLWRTNRLLVLVLVFAFFGLLGPLTAAYLPELIGLASQSEGIEVTVPDPVAADGIAQYLGNITQIGLIAVAAVGAMAMAVDARPGLAAFYRTRQPGVAAWIMPRWVATTLAAAVAWTVGLLAAVYETVVLIGDLPLPQMVAGWAFWIVYLAFAVAVVALASGVVRSTVAVTVLAAGLLIAIGVLGVVPQIKEWVPGYLVGAPAELAAGATEPSDYLRSMGVCMVATVGALAGAVALVRRREL